MKGFKMAKIVQQVAAEKPLGFAISWDGDFPARIELYTINGIRYIDYAGKLVTCTHKEPSEAFEACLKTITRFKKKEGL